tara:strand:- start:584 stop:1327 length:744 start_codon:yes stop_codon:yes gene_type:complete
MLLANKTAVVTGANRGIGQSIIDLFSKNGANIFACSREVNDKFSQFIKLTEQKYKNKIIPLELDLSNIDSIKSAFAKIKEENLEIDILINNAATIHTALFNMTSIDKLKEIFEINFFSQTLFTQYISKLMIKNNSGSIVYMSSSSAIDSNEGRSAYSASKAAIISQAKTLSRELGRHNIRVNAIAPGLTKTDMMYENTSKEIIDQFKNNISLNRYAEKIEVANVALFLSSELSSYINGQTIRVDGGL